MSTLCKKDEILALIDQWDDETKKDMEDYQKIKNVVDNHYYDIEELRLKSDIEDKATNYYKNIESALVELERREKYTAYIDVNIIRAARSIDQDEYDNNCNKTQLIVKYLEDYAKIRAIIDNNIETISETSSIPDISDGYRAVINQIVNDYISDQSYIGQVRRSAENIRRAIDDIKDFSKNISNELETIED